MNIIALPGKPSTPSIIVAIPTLNEERHVETCVCQMLGQIGPDDTIVVADGGSQDDTPGIVSRLAKFDRRIKLVHNPRRIQSAAINRVAELADENVSLMIRVDAHATYPADFVERLVEARHVSQAASVVVPMKAVGIGTFQRGAAAAQNSVLGNGGSPHRRGAASRFVDHGHHALFSLDAFRAIGGYDETFTHNEDFEFDHRLRDAGGTIFLCQQAQIGYFPRETLLRLVRQYVNHGRGRARSAFKHRLRPKLRQLVPVAILAGCVGGVLLSPFAWQAALMPLAYVGLCLAWGIGLAIKARDTAVLFAGPAAIAMHLAWAIGFVSQAARELVGRNFRRPPHGSAASGATDP